MQKRATHWVETPPLPPPFALSLQTSAPLITEMLLLRSECTTHRSQAEAACVAFSYFLFGSHILVFKEKHRTRTKHSAKSIIDLTFLFKRRTSGLKEERTFGYRVMDPDPTHVRPSPRRIVRVNSNSIAFKKAATYSFKAPVETKGMSYTIRR